VLGEIDQFAGKGTICYRAGSLSDASACRHAVQTISSLWRERRALVDRLLLGLTV
jgi:hypothetical protein